MKLQLMSMNVEGVGHVGEARSSPDLDSLTSRDQPCPLQAFDSLEFCYVQKEI